MLIIYIDADGCPVKEEIYRVARRHGLQIFVVSNSWMRLPSSDSITPIVVEGDFNAADDWIVDHVESGDIVITADIPLAARCLENGADVIGHKGRLFTEDSISEALAKRELMSYLRDLGTITGGPAPFQKKDRSRFLHQLDESIRKIKRDHDID